MKKDDVAVAYLLGFCFLVSIATVLNAESENDTLETKKLPGYESIVRKVAPSVVNLSFVRETSRGKGIVHGSGVILSEDGFIVTNYHVVENAETVGVSTMDRRYFSGKVLGFDKEIDVAVIKADASGLKPIKLGDSSKLEVGELVLALGNPQGLKNSVSAGIVSSTNRTDLFKDKIFENYIQTDAAINPGNSGGALVDGSGALIGINTMILSKSPSIGFAIPVNMVKNLTDQIIETGKVSRGKLGVRIADPTPKESSEMNLPSGIFGVLILEVTEGGPADQAGLQKGDVLVKFAGEDSNREGVVVAIAATLPPGHNVEVELFRSGEKITKTISLGR